MHGSYIYKKMNILKNRGYYVEQTNKHEKKTIVRKRQINDKNDEVKN